MIIDGVENISNKMKSRIPFTFISQSVISVAFIVTEMINHRNL